MSFILSHRYFSCYYKILASKFFIIFWGTDLETVLYFKIMLHFYQSNLLFLFCKEDSRLIFCRLNFLTLSKGVYKFQKQFIFFPIYYRIFAQFRLPVCHPFIQRCNHLTFIYTLSLSKVLCFISCFFFDCGI